MNASKQPAGRQSNIQGAAGAFCLALLSILILGALETAFRLTDNWKLTELRLVPRALPGPSQPSDKILAAMRSLVLDPEADPAWAAISPGVIPPGIPDPACAPFVTAGRTQFSYLAGLLPPADPQLGRLDLISRVWNKNYVDKALASGKGMFRQFGPEGVLTFDPGDTGVSPLNRLIPNNSTGFCRINGLGFRGPDIVLPKPSNTVRIAFLGASTTIDAPSDPYSYPEYVGHWLNAWAKAKGLIVSFDVVNAGRPGLSSTDFAAIAAKELPSLAPDLIVYYEGSNQFDARGAIATGGPFPPAPVIMEPLSRLAKYSALARRMFFALVPLLPGAGLESAKPDYAIGLAQGIDESDPDPDAPGLPLSLPVIVKDLDAIKASAEAMGARLVLSSFVWLAEDGLRLDPVGNFWLHDYLNRYWWPMRYRDMRRLADLQNRVFAKWAASRQVSFLETDAVFPRDPALFRDAIHMTPDGVRLKAWIIFQSLLPLIREGLAQGALPRTATGQPGTAPLPRIFAKPQPVPVKTLAPFAFDSVHPLPLSGFVKASSEADIRSQSGGIAIVTPRGDYHYAAKMALAIDAAPQARRAIKIRARTSAGQAAFGVLSQDESRWICAPSPFMSPEFEEIYVELPPGLFRGWLVLANNNPGGGASTAAIENVELVQGPGK